MRRLALAFVLLWAAFAAVGLGLHEACKGRAQNELGWVDISGYDSEGFLTHLILPQGMMETNHRHPLLSLTVAPIVAVGMTVHQKLGEEPAKRAVLVCYAFFGALGCLLLWLVLAKANVGRAPRIAALALWLSFAHVWIVGGVAESFTLSIPIFLGTLLMVVCGVRDVRAWLGVSVLAGGVTVTNGVKPLLAWIAADASAAIRSLRRRTVLWTLAGGVVLLAFSVLALFAKWTWLDHISVRTGIRCTVEEVTAVLPRNLSPVQRLWFVWQLFWCEPMMLHGSVIAKSYVIAGYASFVPHVVGAAMLLLAGWSAVLNFRLPVVRAALAMCSVDVILHVIVGWGAREGQIYCAHWLWVLPLLLALLPRRTWPLTALLAVAVAAWNLTMCP